MLEASLQGLSWDKQERLREGKDSHPVSVGDMAAGKGAEEEEDLNEELLMTEFISGETGPDALWWTSHILEAHRSFHPQLQGLPFLPNFPCCVCV